MEGDIKVKGQRSTFIPHIRSFKGWLFRWDNEKQFYIPVQKDRMDEKKINVMKVTLEANGEAIIGFKLTPTFSRYFAK